MENERRTNRSCTIGALWVAAVCAVICLAGLMGAFSLPSRWMYLYAATIILPILALAAYARKRDYRGTEIKHLIVLVMALVPASMSVPSAFGFILMPLPIVVAGRYFSRRFVWHTYGNVVLLSFFLLILHARYGIPCYVLCTETIDELKIFISGRDLRMEYWRDLVVWCWPSLVVCMSFFAITVSRLCKDHLEAMTLEAKTNARLADVEKGLTLAAAVQVASSLCPSSAVLCPEDNAGTKDDGQRTKAETKDRGLWTLEPGPRRRSPTASRNARSARRLIPNSPRSLNGIRRRP